VLALAVPVDPPAPVPFSLFSWRLLSCHSSRFHACALALYGLLARNPHTTIPFADFDKQRFMLV
jgi:hypothetical protein